jgi:hypothetical protein
MKISLQLYFRYILVEQLHCCLILRMSSVFDDPILLECYTVLSGNVSFGK